MAIGTAVHLVLGVVGFGFSLVPLLVRLRGPVLDWALHGVMAMAMGIMAALGMTGPTRLPLVALLLVAAAWAWYQLPRRHEWLHVVADLATMAFLVLLAPGTDGPDPADTHVHHAGAAGENVGVVAVLIFWGVVHVCCRAQVHSRPHRRDAICSLGMIAAMGAMLLML
ncbi:DUF5134 domain-containing protein [Lipingzhangella sp. LS1_29]|uniref:DUF5134 domain-containing protein n=1 Tax=Lipingzhangella rawalii TaxID=2055835 RepID=A0ABU2H6W2_9ACTN|nr:DUF5134 domain-containing protein [Lipingzhangella rawalii]